MNLKLLFTVCAGVVAAATAQAQIMPYNNVYYSPYAAGVPYVAYYDHSDISPAYYAGYNRGWYGNYAYHPYHHPYVYASNYGYSRPFYGNYGRPVTNNWTYHYSLDRAPAYYTDTYTPYYGWNAYPRYSVGTPMLFNYKTWDGVPIYYSDTYYNYQDQRTWNHLHPTTNAGRVHPISFNGVHQPAPLPSVYNARYIDEPVGMAYNMGTMPQRERWWLNRVIEETTTGDRISWNIDNFQYQFRADDGIYRDHATWRACRRGALMRRASQVDQWSIREGDFCRTQYGDWEYVGG
jgi:hypothetical protein